MILVINSIFSSIPELQSYYNLFIISISHNILALIIKRKGLLNSDARLIESDIVELKAILRNLEGEHDNIEILKYTNIITKKKYKFFDYLKSRLNRSIQSRDKILRAITQTHKLSVPQFNIKNNDNKRENPVQLLLNSIQEYRNEEDFLINDIERLKGELEYSKTLLSSPRSKQESNQDLILAGIKLIVF